MPLKTRQPARQAARLAILAAALGLLSGCQGIGSLSLSQSGSQVRIIDVSSASPALDIYQGHDALAYNLGFGTITSYVPVAPGTYSLAANSTGTAQTVSAGKGTFLPASQYTVLIGDTAAGPQPLTLKDQNQPAPRGQIALRLIDQAERVGPVDLYLVPPGQTFADARPIAANIVFGANTGYLNVPTGTYTQNWIIVLNQYEPPYIGGNGFNWSVQMILDPVSGRIQDGNTNAFYGNLVRDQWVEARVHIDLAADTYTTYYNNVLQYGPLNYSHAWSAAGTARIAAIDLFSEDAVGILYDDVSVAAAGSAARGSGSTP